MLISTMQANTYKLKSKWSREIAQMQVLTTAFNDGREICFLNKKSIMKYWQYTMTAIQMIKSISISSKLNQLPQNKENELLY